MLSDAPPDGMGRASPPHVIARCTAIGSEHVIYKVSKGNSIIATACKVLPPLARTARVLLARQGLPHGGGAHVDLGKHGARLKGARSPWSTLRNTYVKHT